MQWKLMDDKDHIELSRIGMQFGGIMAVAAALVAIGGEELLHYNWIGSILLPVGVIIVCVYTGSFKKRINKLKKSMW